jgi:hypothetical protein
MTRETKIGIRIEVPPAGKGLKFFGTDEVNDLIRQGWRVVSIQPGGAIITKLGEDKAAQTTRLALGGCDIKVVLESPGPAE